MDLMGLMNESYGGGGPSSEHKFTKSKTDRCDPLAKLSAMLLGLGLIVNTISTECGSRDLQYATTTLPGFSCMLDSCPPVRVEVQSMSNAIYWD